VSCNLATAVASTGWGVIRHNPNRQRLIDSLVDCGARSLMPAALLVLLRSFALICGGHRAVALENLALRQQLAVFKRTVQRVRFTNPITLRWRIHE
jgi:hypothetical protein